MSGVRYEGERIFEPKVWRVDEDGTRTPLERHVVYHVAGEEWIEWGYGGSGPAELAINLLVDVVGPDDARCGRCRGRRYFRSSVCGECGGTGVGSDLLRLHQDLKWAWIAGLPERRWTLEADALRAWILVHLPRDSRLAG